MEGNMAKLPEDSFPDAKNLSGECLLAENPKMVDLKIPQKNVFELSQQEEESLQIHLDKLKKENFTLQASIKAWQTTLKNKLAEFKEADLKLDEIHNEIWSEREKFCSKADEFNDVYGVFSDWWAMQMKFVSDLENLEQKTLEDRRCREEIEKLEKEVEELKKEINGLQEGQQLAEVEVHATADDDRSPVREEDAITEAPPDGSDAKKVRFSEADDRINIYHEKEPTKDDLYSFVDLEKLRMVNRNRNRLGNVKKWLMGDMS